MLRSTPHSIYWFHLDSSVDNVWQKLLSFFRGDYWKSYTGVFQVGLYDTPEGVTWTSSESTSAIIVLELIAQACEKRQRFSVTCRFESAVYTFLPPSRKNSAVVHPTWQVLVVRNGEPQMICADFLTEQLLLHGFVMQ